MTIATQIPSPRLSLTAQQREALAAAARFPLLSAIHGRRSRRFPVGGSIPSGPLACTSTRDVEPLDEVERALILWRR
ncbi:Uncharacterised protein [Mycobacteroides abscessus subsp. abscessus]|nr:Uncharacterised protein [Mycobacteroides abscessus subsp. abscessus]